MSEILQPIKWNDEKFSLGIAIIDEQHKQLVGLLNSLIINKDPEARQFTAKVFTTLLVYIRTHFQMEEKLLHRMGYPGLKEHAKEHQGFVQQVFQLKEQYDRSQHSPEVLKELLPLLSNWLTCHILQTDKAYAKYLFS